MRVGDVAIGGIVLTTSGVKYEVVSQSLSGTRIRVCAHKEREIVDRKTGGIRKFGSRPKPILITSEAEVTLCSP